MSPATIRTRTVASGRRYDVRYRLGGRGYPVLHGGTFRTLTEARTRRDIISGELAAGRDPRILFAQLRDPAPTTTIAAAAADWLATRVDVKPATKRTYADHVKRITLDLGARNPEQVTAGDVRSWISSLSLSPATVRNYVGTLRAILDHAGVEPNPARDRSVRIPKTEKRVVEPPSSGDFTRILSMIGPRWRLPLRTLEQTGMRISELTDLEWRDVDVHSSRFRLRHGKTAHARRWVHVPDWLMAEVAAICPPDDRTPERRVFPGFTRGAARNAMVRACRAAGLPDYSPHDLRHRYASVQIKRGVPVTELSAQLGHAKSSLTLDTYSHVLLAEEDA